MTAFGVKDLLLLMTASLLIMGVISLVAGVLTLLFRVSGREVQALAANTLRLAQKGITDEISGLVGNASSLLEAVNQLVRTSTGVGVFLILTSFVLFIGSYYLILQLQ